MNSGQKVLFLLGALVVRSAFALPCQNASGVPTNVGYDLTTTLTAAQNQVGETLQLLRRQDVDVQAVCPKGSAPAHETYRSYMAQSPVVETEGTWKYQALIPPYLEGAMAIEDATTGRFYPPVSYLQMGIDENVDRGEPFHVFDSNLILQLKIVRPFIGTLSIPLRTMFSVYVTTGENDSLSNVVYNIVYSGTITVPQSCEINAGQTVLVDFGSLYSGDFTHAGEKPVNIRAKTFRVPVKCSGVDSHVNLSMNLQATPDTHFSQSIASDNPDVGVVVTNEQGAILTPDDPASAVPFVTDDSGNASLTLQAYPVSTTGNTPAEGKFTSLANLKVEFD